jgi:uncharacterized protein (DUF488 family)
MPETIYTIGHSTHAIGEFIALLQAHEIETLADIRTIPKSRHNPQFAQAALKASLKKKGIQYIYMKDLGGLRHTVKDSPNGAWRNSSFRGYADYMQTDGFGAALDILIETGKGERTAIMCAEAVPWRCHRSLVADALLVRGIAVLDIMPDGRIAPHKLTSFAHVKGRTITYPPESLSLPGL